MRASLKDAEKRIRNIVDAIEQGVCTASTQRRLEELESGIQQELIQQPPVTAEFMKMFFDQFRGGNPKDPVYQQRVIDRFINSVFVFPDKISDEYQLTGSMAERIGLMY